MSGGVVDNSSADNLVPQVEPTGDLDTSFGSTVSSHGEYYIYT